MLRALTLNGFQANTSILLLFKVQRAGRSSGTCVRILFLYLYIFLEIKVSFIVHSELLNATCPVVIICSTHIDQVCNDL
jgi:hypothetical protein